MTETNTLAAIIQAISDIVAASATWASTAISTVTGQPLLLFFVLSGFLGVGISLFKRLTRI